MAFLKDALALVDSKLGTTFAETKPDPAKLRSPMIKGIDRTLAQFSEGKSKVPHRWWSVSNGVVEFAPKLAGDAIQINGEDRLYIPQERFPDFLGKFRAAVDAGEFDAELANHGKGDAGVAVPKAARAKRAFKAPGTGGGKGWSEERRAKFAESIAARNAAKASA